MNLETRITRLEHQTSGREPMVIVVRYDDPGVDTAEQERAYARAMAYAEPYLRGVGRNVIMEIEAGHVRLETPTARPLLCWCGRVHQRGEVVPTEMKPHQ